LLYIGNEACGVDTTTIVASFMLIPTD